MTRDSRLDARHVVHRYEAEHAVRWGDVSVGKVSGSGNYKKLTPQALLRVGSHAPATFVSSTGLARSQADKAIPFLVNDDLQLVALVESQTKTLMSIADVVCSVCRTTGATALNIIDHDLQQKETHVISRF